MSGLPTYYTLDTTFAWRAPLTEHLGVALLFRVKNISDQHYDEVAGAPTFGPGPVGFNPAPGRNYEGGVTVSWK